jgi:hypothetical protein
MTSVVGYRALTVVGDDGFRGTEKADVSKATGE